MGLAYATPVAGVATRPGQPAARKSSSPRTMMSGAMSLRLATPTGLEPAASAVTGRRANQLRYGALLCCSHRAVEG